MRLPALLEYSDDEPPAAVHRPAVPAVAESPVPVSHYHIGCADSLNSGVSAHEIAVVPLLLHGSHNISVSHRLVSSLSNKIRLIFHCYLLYGIRPQNTRA